MTHLEQLERALQQVRRHPTATMTVWQGPTARNFRRVTVAQMQALARHAAGEPVAREALEYLRDVLREAPNDHIEVAFWTGNGHTTRIPVGVLRQLANVTDGHKGPGYDVKGIDGIREDIDGEVL